MLHSHHIPNVVWQRQSRCRGAGLSYAATTKHAHLKAQIRSAKKFSEAEPGGRVAAWTALPPKVPKGWFGRSAAKALRPTLAAMAATLPLRPAHAPLGSGLPTQNS